MTSTPKTPDDGVPEPESIEPESLESTSEAEPALEPESAEPESFKPESGEPEPETDESESDTSGTAESESDAPGTAESESDAPESVARTESGAPPGEPERHGGHVVLGGRYELGDVLGTGATFTVYEARPHSVGADQTDTDDGDWPLVVKVLHPHLVDDAFSRACLQHEVDASEQVDHPGVVKVLATGEDDVAGAVVPWTVMHRFPGKLLSEVAAGRGLPWQAALQIVVDLLDGLGAVHDAGLVHRDVAPRNVMVDEREDGTFGVGLLDLGLTGPGGGEGDGETVSGSIIGMSPEQAKGQPLDARSDLYAAGALLYYGITGHAPFQRAVAQDVLRAHVEAPVPAPSARKPMVPGAVDRIVARAMAKNPLRRYPDAPGMASTIRALLDGPGGQVPGPAVAAAVTAGLGEPTSDQTEELDQVGGGTLRVGQLTDDVGGEARTTVVGAYVPAESGGQAGTIPPPPPPIAGGADPRPDKRRGRVIALVVAAVLLIGAGGVAVASLITDDWGRRPSVVSITREASLEPKESSSPTQSDSEDDYTPPPPDTDYPRTPTSNPSPTTSPSPDPSQSPQPTTDPSQSPQPTTEPTNDATQPPTQPATPPPSDPPADGGEGGGDGGGEGGILPNE